MKRRLRENIEIGDRVFIPFDEYYVTVVDIDLDKGTALVDGPMGKESRNLKDLEKSPMDESYLKEGRKKVIRLSETDLTRIVKRVIKETKNTSSDETPKESGNELFSKEFDDEYVRGFCKLADILYNNSTKLDIGREIKNFNKRKIQNLIEKGIIDDNMSEDEFNRFIKNLPDRIYQKCRNIRKDNMGRGIVEDLTPKIFQKLFNLLKSDKNKSDELTEEKDRKESTWEKIKRKLKGVSDKQLIYNMENDLPWDWNGTKEGFYEKSESGKYSKGSN